MIRRLHSKVNAKLWDFDDWVCEKEPERLVEVLLAVTEKLRQLLCRMLGHCPIADQCNIPAHDYCAWCNKSLPNQAHKESHDYHRS